METAMNRFGALKSLVLAAAACFGPHAIGQDLIPTAPEQTGGVILVGGTVHTVSGETIENGAVGFRGGKITLLAGASIMQTIQLTDDTEIVDVEGKHIYPGLFAADTRLGLTETSSVRATNDSNEIGSYTPEVRANVAINPDSTLIPVTRLNGVLLAGVTPTGGRIPGRASVIRLTGWTWEDMTIRADAGLVVNWPGVRPGFGAFSGTDKDDNARIAERLAEITLLFDSAEAYLAAKEADASRPGDMRLGAMEHYLGSARPGSGDEPTRRLLIDAEDYDQIVSAVSFAAARGIPAAIVGGRDAAMCAGLLREHDIPVIVGGTHRFPKRADSPHDHAYTLPARLHEAGVRFCITGAERDGNVRNLAYEAAMAARFGLDEDEALRAITLSPAEILGVSDEYGSIERGKSATLIVTDGDVLEVTTNIERAYIDGRAIEMKSKQTDLRDKYLEKYRQLGIIED